MSKTQLGILFSAIALITIGTFLELSAFSGVTGVLLVAALVYAFHVAKGEVLLLTRSMEVREDGRKANAVTPRRDSGKAPHLGSRAVS